MCKKIDEISIWLILLDFLNPKENAWSDDLAAENAISLQHPTRTGDNK